MLYSANLPGVIGFLKFAVTIRFHSGSSSVAGGPNPSAEPRQNTTYRIQNKGRVSDKKYIRWHDVSMLRSLSAGFFGPQLSLDI